MELLSLLAIIVCCILAFQTSASSAASARLPSYPLAVKSPYLSTWLSGSQAQDVATAQPTFWNGIPLTWIVLARVDNKTYSLFGSPYENVTAATTTSASYTASHTYFGLQAGSATFELDFFSPVLPGKSEYAHQSLPYSYLTVTASSHSSAPARVQLLSAIDQTWTAQNGAAALNFTTSGNAGFFWYYNANAVPFVEVNDRALYGSTIFGTRMSSGVSHACSSAADILRAFSGNGSFAAANSTRPCANFDQVALVKDLGSCKQPESMTVIVGQNRARAVSYLNSTHTGYHRTQWPTIRKAVEFVVDSYDHVQSRSLAFDAILRSRAQRVSTDFGRSYADIVEASVRQVFGGMELTVPVNNMTSDPVAFLKEISSDGNINTIDFIFQSWPIFLSLNPAYLKLLLEPVLQYSQSGRWPQPYMIHDIGAHYPNATGHDDGVAEQMPLFETSALFILLYAYQKFTGDLAYSQRYASLLKAYAEYLAPRSLYPDTQIISVDVIRPFGNETGLAIQSAIGLSAAAILTGNTTYAETARSNADAIYKHGLGLDGSTPDNSTHFTWNYNNSATWNVIFPAYSDVVLNLSTFPLEAWNMQSAWYLRQMQPGGLPFAGPVTNLNYTGSAIDWGLTDWNVVAAAVSSDEVQQRVVDTTHAFMTNGLNQIPFGTKYVVEGANLGRWIGNQNRASVGSHFALLALNQGTWYS